MNAIEVQNLSKKFQITEGLDESRGALQRLKIKSPKQRDIWALKDLNLEVKKGEWFGIVGENGSGKTTLLKILGNILYPTEGEINVKGKVASLLGLGTGFKEEFTAKENVYLYCSLMGLSKGEIDRRYEDIVSFSELYDYMNTKFKKFSDGMKMRLAFAAAMNVEADIFLSDEVLAVGDGEFQSKCMKRLKEFKEKDKTIVYVSHDLDSIKEWCDRALFLDDGKVRVKGDVEEVLKKYRKFLTWKGKNEDLRKFKGRLKPANDVQNLKFYNKNNKESYIFREGEEVRGEIEFPRNFDKVKINFLEETTDERKLTVYSKNINKDGDVYKLNFGLGSLWLDENRYKVSIEADNKRLVEKFYIEVVEGNKKLPENMVLQGQETDKEFPHGKFYVFGDLDPMEQYEKGKGVAVYKETDMEAIGEKYEKGVVIDGVGGD